MAAADAGTVLAVQERGLGPGAWGLGGMGAAEEPQCLNHHQADKCAPHWAGQGPRKTGPPGSCGARSLWGVQSCGGCGLLGPPLAATSVSLGTWPWLLVGSFGLPG